MTLSWVPPGEEEVSGHYDDNLAENLPTSRYYYDGQMMVEDDYTVEGQNEPVVTVMRYGIGARGIDFLAKSVDGGAETVGFPLYDGHGNMIATLGRSENSPYFGVADLRSYDVWGSVRSGSTTGDPKQRYCANLGHVQDDESGLIYMRARYYEPWSGRFVSEDRARSGPNWYVYARSNPQQYADVRGEYIDTIDDLIGSLSGWLGLYLFGKRIRVASDASEVEAAWEEFMKYWNYSPIESLTGELGGFARDLYSIISYLKDVASELLGEATAATLVGGLLTASSFAGKMGKLSFAYNLRLGWYLRDADNP